MKYTIIFAIFLVFVATSEARIFVSIDTFNDFQLPVIQTVLNGNDQTAPYDWWSPYYQTGGTGGAPAAAFLTTTSALGGQRDTILGYESVSPSGATALITIVGDSASVAFPLDYVGGGYFQWDGDDAAGGASAFPGAILNTSPGIGSGEAISNDDQTIDFTFGGRGAGLSITISADHEINYFLDAVDSLGNQNTYDFIVTPSDEAEELTFFIRFDDPIWSLSGSFDFSDVAGFQVRVLTFTGTASNNAIDTEFRFLQILGYEISGTVTLDCLCDQITAVTPVNNEQINLFRLGNPTIIDSVFTDINGDYLFNDQVLLVDGSYTVCLDNQAQDICITTPSCVDVVLANLIDSIDNDFALTAVSTLNIPVDVNLECGECTDPVCTGFATIDGCGTGTVQINQFTDVTSVIGCVETILRTWTDPDTLQTGVQRIVLTDTTAPVIVVPAEDSLNNDCATPAETLAAYTARFGGAQATDCSAFSFSFPPVSIGPCNSIDIVFTATDICGFSTPTTGTYSTVDSTLPVYNTLPQSDSAECDLKSGSSTTALNTWAVSRAFSVASDDCTATGQLVFSDDFVGFPSGCLGSETVTFSVTDTCGNLVSAPATFTISDTTAPLIVTEASDVTSECTSVGTTNDDDFRAWLAIFGGAVATDQCITDDNLLTWTNDAILSVIGGANTCDLDQVVTFTVLDDCAFSSSTVATFTIQDTLSPFITTPASSLVVQCDGAGNTADYNNFVATNAGAAVSDACDSGISFTSDAPVSPPTICGDNVLVTFSATDFCGVNTVQTSATYTIVDNTAPFFASAPQDQTSECSASTQTEFDSWLAANAFAVGDDACSSAGLVINNNFVGGDIAVVCNNAVTVGFFVSDPCGNDSPMENAVFTIVDTVDPVISPPASNLAVDCDLTTNQSDYNTWIATNGGASATDSCGTVSFSNNAGPISSDCAVSNTVQFTASDGCGNFAVTTASFSITDVTFPTEVSAAFDLTVECNGSGNTADLNTWLSTRAGFTASDTCSAISYTDDFVELTGTSCLSSSFVTFTGCDSCSNCISSSATFSIQDTLGPIISPLASSQIVECDPASNSNQFQDFLDNQGGADAVDQCNTATLVWTSSFTASPQGCNAEDVTFTVTDPCGFSSSTTATFTILDSVAPVFDTAPQDLMVECDGSGNVADYQNWVSSFAGATATDACAIFLTFSSTAAADGPIGCGTEVGSFTVEDECTNAVTDTAVYQVVDTQPPVISPLAQDMIVECDITTNTDQLTAWLSSNAGAAAFDSCYGNNVSFSNNFVALIPDLCVSSATVQFTASDPCGQSALTTATFTIDDTQPPVFTTPASNALFECDGTTENDIQNYLANNGDAVASDSCSFVTFANDFVASPDECNGPIPVTFTATDLCGNSASSTGSVEIDDTVNPSFFNFPVDRTILCDESSDPSQTGTPSANDSCDSDVTVSFNDFVTQEPDERLCPGDTIITRQWLALDDCGNSLVQDQIITVTIPVGDCIFTPCPPCGSQICCESSLEPVPCNPVTCNPVPCTTTECGSVPCLPVVCGGSAPPIFGDDDDEYIYVPPSDPTSPEDCEPVYIYVFDDDEENANTFVVANPDDNDSSSSASTLFMSFFVIALALLAMF